MHVGGIFCDLAKAHDCMNQAILLVKLHFCGIQGVSEDWVRSYSTNRRQKVEVESPNLIHIFFLWLGYNATWSSSRINPRASIVTYVTLQSSTCFEHQHAHLQEDKLYYHSIWYRHSL